MDLDILGMNSEMDPLRFHSATTIEWSRSSGTLTISLNPDLFMYWFKVMFPGYVHVSLGEQLVVPASSSL